MRNTIGESCFKPARLAIFISMALSGVITTGHARDYFNPELLQLDNPGMKGADLSYLSRELRRRGHIVLILLLTTRRSTHAISNSKPSEIPVAKKDWNHVYR